MFSATAMVADRLVRVLRASLGACVHVSELATPIGVITHHEMIVLSVQGVFNMANVAPRW